MARSELVGVGGEGPLDYPPSMDPATRRFAVRLAAVPLASLFICPAAPGQSGAPRPAVAVLNLRFDGEHANVLQAGDTAIVAAATSKPLEPLAASGSVTIRC